jgi:GNAT superfamily N-acetyltransferase
MRYELPVEIATRPATAEDIDALLANLRAGFQSYADFAPAGWVPPEPDRDLTLSILERPTTWALLATLDREPVAHVSFTPARGDPFSDPEGWRDAPWTPGKAHLWQLFVLPAYWGAGIAAPLHDAAIEAMRDQGYERARLFTPASHLRARRFYERRGWVAGPKLDDTDLGLELLEYRVELSR